MEAKGACLRTLPATRPYMESLFQCIYELRGVNLLGFIEQTLLQLRERARRLLAMYGAVHGLASGSSWKSTSYDATNCIYAGVWKMWLMEHPPNQHPWARSITNCNTAGNVMEASLGVVWLHQHCRSRTPHEFRHYLSCDEYECYKDVAEEVFNIIHEFGEALLPWVPWIEGAIIGYKGVWEQKNKNKKHKNKKTKVYGNKTLRSNARKKNTMPRSSTYAWKR